MVHQSSLGGPGTGPSTPGSWSWTTSVTISLEVTPLLPNSRFTPLLLSRERLGLPVQRVLRAGVRRHQQTLLQHLLLSGGLQLPGVSCPPHQAPLTSLSRDTIKFELDRNKLIVSRLLSDISYQSADNLVDGLTKYQEEYDNYYK